MEEILLYHTLQFLHHYLFREFFRQKYNLIEFKNSDFSTFLSLLSIKAEIVQADTIVQINRKS